MTQFLHLTLYWKYSEKCNSTIQYKIDKKMSHVGNRYVYRSSLAMQNVMVTWGRLTEGVHHRDPLFYAP